MKIRVIGSIVKANVIHGCVIVGNLVVLAHKGKVKRGYVIRSKSYNNFMVSYDVPAVIILAESKRVKGPISKGLKDELRSLSNIQI